MRVLHLDPDAPSRRDLAAELEAAGHRVEQAETVADALARDAAQPCDLIVTETRLADGGVLDFLRRLHLARNGKLPPLAVLAAESEPGLRELCERAGVRRFLRKADDWPVNASELHGLLAELEPPTARAVSAASRPSSRVFRGSLESVDLVEVVQLLNLGRKSGTLLLSGGSREGRLHLREGDLIAAACGASTGAEAFRALLGARGGTFRFEVGEAPVTRTIHEPTTALLLDILRQEDEEGREGLSGARPEASTVGAFAFDEMPPSREAAPLDGPAGTFGDSLPPFTDAAAALDHSAPLDDSWAGESPFDEPRSLDHAAGDDHSAALDRAAGLDDPAAPDHPAALDHTWSDDSSSGPPPSPGHPASRHDQPPSRGDHPSRPPDHAPAPAGTEPPGHAPGPPGTEPRDRPPRRHDESVPGERERRAVHAAPGPAGAQRNGPSPVAASPLVQASRDASRPQLRRLRLVPDLTWRKASRRRGPPISRLWLFAGGAAAALAAGYAVHTAGTHSSDAAPELQREDVRTLLLEAAEDQARIDSLEALVQELLRASAEGSGARH